MRQIKNSIITTSDYTVDLAFLPTGKRWEPNTQTNNRFIESGEHLVDYLAQAIDNAQEFICFTSFIFQDGKIVEALERAAERGVKVFVLTSTLRISQQNIYDDGDEQKAVSSFKDLLNNKMRNKTLVRCADNIHAKYLLIDPKSSRAKGYLATCNFTEKATKENPELVAVLNKNEVAELFKVFVWHFWEGTTDEQKNSTDFAKLQAVKHFEMPDFQSILQTSTAAKQTTIRDYTLEIIQSATSKIVFSSFGFDVSHSLGKALLAKCAAGLDVTIFARNRSKQFIGHLEKLAKAGAKIFTHDLLHAKFIAVDDEKGAIFTANFEKHGMDEGVEVGLKLNKNDMAILQNITTRWQNSFSHYTKADVKLNSLPDNYFAMENKGLRMQTIKNKESKKQTIKPQNLNEIIKVWAKKEDFDKKVTKNYLFELNLDLEEMDLGQLINEEELTPNIYWGEYEIEVESKKSKDSKETEIKKIKKQAILLMENADFNGLSTFQKYQQLPVFALKV